MSNKDVLSFEVIEATPETVRQLLSQESVTALEARHWSVLQHTGGGRLGCEDGGVRYSIPHSEPIISQTEIRLHDKMSYDNALVVSENNGQIRITLDD